MRCSNCGNEMMAGEKFCSKCGKKAETICPSCGKALKDGEIFCGQCGFRMNGVEQAFVAENPQVVPVNDISLKMQRLPGLLNVIAGGLLILIGLVDIGYEWGDIALCSGAGLLVIGILRLMKKSVKAIAINGIVFGALAILLGFYSDADFDWGLISIFIGIALLVEGILSLLHKSWKITAIVQIVFSGLLLLAGLANSDYDWGITALIAGAQFLTIAILKFVNAKKVNVSQ